MTQSDSAIRRIKAVLMIQILGVPVLWFHWYIMWTSDQLPEVMASAQPGLLLVLLFSLVPLYLLRKKRFTYGLKITLYSAAWFALTLPVSLLLTQLLFGGGFIPILSSFLLLIPAGLVLVFVRTHEFEPMFTETDQFDVFIQEIEAHSSAEEGLQYVVDYIQERHDEFSPRYADRLLAYLSERNDEIGLAARARTRGPFADEDMDV